MVPKNIIFRYNNNHNKIFNNNKNNNFTFISFHVNKSKVLPIYLSNANLSAHHLRTLGLVKSR